MNENSSEVKITVSIVSHAHDQTVANLVQQLLDCAEVEQLLLTCNVPEALTLPDDPRVQIIHNARPRGFGANHNAAFALCMSPWFVVLNPDVVLMGNPFPALLLAAKGNNVALVSPRAVDTRGSPEDCWRRFPTPIGLIYKFFGLEDGRYEHAAEEFPAFDVDWVSGLCMLFRYEAYTALGGFDERYFLYYEDVDICTRSWSAGLRVLACPAACLTHDAQRASRRSFRHMRWHIKSMLRYFGKHWGRLPSGAVV